MAETFNPETLATAIHDSQITVRNAVRDHAHKKHITDIDHPELLMKDIQALIIANYDNIDQNSRPYEDDQVRIRSSNLVHNELLYHSGQQYHPFATVKKPEMKHNLEDISFLRSSEAGKNSSKDISLAAIQCLEYAHLVTPQEAEQISQKITGNIRQVKNNNADKAEQALARAKRVSKPANQQQRQGARI